MIPSVSAAIRWRNSSRWWPRITNTKETEDDSHCDDRDCWWIDFLFTHLFSTSLNNIESYLQKLWKYVSLTYESQFNLVDPVRMGLQNCDSGTHSISPIESLQRNEDTWTLRSECKQVVSWMTRF
jgi:hypothetical protein